jgi:anti-sigma factor RsiW
LTCLFVRRRIGTYLDGALDERAARSTARHLGGCAPCQREAEDLRRLRALLQRSLTPSARVAELDWSGFWPAIVRGVEDARLRAPAPVARPERWWRPRLALGGAVAAVVIVSLTLWQTVFAPFVPDGPVVVSSAHTEDPRGTVMVYSTHEKDVTVVWVLGLDD